MLALIQQKNAPVWAGAKVGESPEKLEPRFGAPVGLTGFLNRSTAPPRFRALVGLGQFIQEAQKKPPALVIVKPV